MSANPRAVIGGNSLSLDQAKARLETSGFMLARLETLAMAVRDDRIDRGCLKVLVELIDSMNRETWTSWLGRDSLADRIGITAKSAGNYIYQLKALGYIVGEKRETPQANNRVLMHYTLSALSPEELEAAITRAIGSIRGEVDTVVPLKSARQDGQYSEKVPHGTGKKVPAITGNSIESAPSDGQLVTGLPVPAGITETEMPITTGTLVPLSPKSARQDGCSKNNSSITTIEPSGERGVGREEVAKATRLKPDWSLSRAWGNWTLENFHITRDQVYTEAEAFADYWHGKSGKDARKTNWEATWRNWVRNSRAKYRRRKIDKSIAPDLVDASPSTQRTIEEREANEARVAAQGWVIPNQGVTRE